MSAAFILDCSLTMAWCFADEAAPETSRIQDRLEAEAALVPAHWFLEVTNVLAMAERKGRITQAASDEFRALLTRFDIEVDSEPPTSAFERLPPLCRAYRLTSYDAVYLDLAMRRQIPLATLDDALRTAAGRAGVALIGR